jgi:hypothetical protein
VTAVVWFCILTAPCMIFGWPNHWVLAVAGVTAGYLAGSAARRERRGKRGGYLSVVPPTESELQRRLREYGRLEGDEH